MINGLVKNTNQQMLMMANFFFRLAFLDNNEMTTKMINQLKGEIKKLSSLERMKNILQFN